VNKYLHTVASVGLSFTLNYDARNHELKIYVKIFNALLLFTICKYEYLYLKCIVYDKLLKPRQSFRITLYTSSSPVTSVCILEGVYFLSPLEASQVPLTIPASQRQSRLCQQLRTPSFIFSCTSPCVYILQREVTSDVRGYDKVKVK